MGSLSIWHWLIVLLIIALVFGTKKLHNIGSDLGRAIQSFKKGMHENDALVDTQKRESMESTTVAVDTKRKTPPLE